MSYSHTIWTECQDYLLGKITYTQLVSSFNNHNLKDIVDEDFFSALDPQEIVSPCFLLNLDLPEDALRLFTKKSTLYDLLFHLQKKTHYSQFDDILDLIESKRYFDLLTFIKVVLKNNSWQNKLIIAILIIGILIAIAWTVSRYFITLPNFLPIAGIIYAVFNLGYGLYQIFFKCRFTPGEYFQNTIFLLAKSSFDIAGYALWLAFGLTPWIASFAVVALACAGLKELFMLIRVWQQHTKIDTPEDTLQSKQKYARNKYSQYIYRFNAAVKLTSALILVGLMAVWVFVPGGQILTIGMIVAMGVVWLLEMELVRRHTVKLRDQLQLELDEIWKNYPEEQSQFGSVSNCSWRSSCPSSKPKTSQNEIEIENIDDSISEQGSTAETVTLTDRISAFLCCSIFNRKKSLSQQTSPSATPGMDFNDSQPF